MQRYSDIDRDSGVEAYEIEPDSICPIQGRAVQELPLQLRQYGSSRCRKDEAASCSGRWIECLYQTPRRKTIRPEVVI